VFRNWRSIHGIQFFPVGIDIHDTDADADAEQSVSLPRVPHRLGGGGWGVGQFLCAGGNRGCDAQRKNGVVPSIMTS
jgi:hypothetical protein